MDVLGNAAEERRRTYLFPQVHARTQAHADEGDGEIKQSVSEPTLVTIKDEHFVTQRYVHASPQSHVAVEKLQ